MTTSNVEHVFISDKSRLIAQRALIEALSPSAADQLARLNAILEKRNRTVRKSAAGVALLGMGIWLLIRANTYPPVEWLLASATLGGALAAGGTGLLVRQLRQWRERLRLRNTAVAGQKQLEGREGFLWQFETFLQDWDQDLPDEVRATLAPTCNASKAGTLERNLEALRAYWYWVVACEGRMQDALESMGWK